MGGRSEGFVLPRTKTGIEGVDRILNGGIPVGNSVLVTGSCGTGKTTLAAEFLVNGAKEGEAGVFVAVTESTKKLIENLSTFHFFDPHLVTSKKLHFMDMATIYEKAGLDKMEITIGNVPALLNEFFKAVRTLGVKRLVVDSLTGICFQLKNPDSIRDFTFRLSKGLAEIGVTALLIEEVPPNSVSYSSHGIEDAIADGIIVLGNIDQRGYMLRTMHIVKMRGTTHSRAKYVMDLSPYGIIMVPLLKATAGG